MVESQDLQVRLQLYREFLDTGRSPSADQLAARLEISVAEVRESLERLAAGKAIVLQPESREVLMANPLSAVPTPFLVRARDQVYFAPCVWDGLGIIAMLRSQATLETSCPCCGEALQIMVESGQPRPVRGIIHFGLPASCWWQNIVFT